MWGGLGQDPGGSSSDPPPTQELLDKKEQFEEQQVFLAQLKKMARKGEHTSITEEKVEEYANTLTKMNARVKRGKSKREKGDSLSKCVATPTNEKINLLRQQVEAKKALLAERGRNQKGIEAMVTQMKAQLDDSQLLINQAPLHAASLELETYSAQSNAQELYNILVFKDKCIHELNSKVHKLEVNVLDLQENLKVKDSVIDARTKAITLTSENLSRKGKMTLDALDDTKEQMRKMQENFVAFETQMKVDKQKLVIDLEEKNNELIIMQSTNEKLTNQNAVLQEHIADLNLQIDKFEKEIKLETPKIEAASSKKSKKGQKARSPSLDKSSKTSEVENARILTLEATIEDLKSQAASKEVDINLENEEILKLKKQLDENNKSMIKSKAQHKSKIKELTKKVDTFKKISDTNAEVVKLEAENTKLNLKVVELEEEKGNLQLKLVESDTAKDVCTDEQVKELEKEIQEQTDLLADKNESIEILQKKVEESKLEICEMTERLAGLSHLQNDQVKSEITSIHFEETIDAIELEKKELIQEKKFALQENEKLHLEIENLKTEKQEICNKLDTYVQENIELIDKLEKLSAEKVSSAESIEIVENLTQQEKREIEAYQKRLDLTTGSIKNSSEHLDNADLNESVSQLTEETSELMQKIELFTVERREVMEKMENLAQENNQLALKIKEIENNRDVLAETYEQLQNEKEDLDNQLEELQKQNKELSNALEKLEKENEKLKEVIDGRIPEKGIDDYKSALEVQKHEIEELKLQLSPQQELNAKLSNELSNLKTQLKNLTTQNDTMREQINKDDPENERNTITYLQEEIENYKVIVEENKIDLISSSGYINELQNELDIKQNEVLRQKVEIGHLNANIADLNDAISELEKQNSDSKNENIESMSNQLEALKQLLNDNIEQTKEYETELNENSLTNSKLNMELKTVNNKILAAEDALASKVDDIRALHNDMNEKNAELESLRAQIKEKDEKFHKVVDDFKGKYIALQGKIETNAGSIDDIKYPLENKIQELETKNKEQLEKMKKIAANLKKKTGLLQESERKCTDFKEKWENEAKEKKELEIRTAEQDTRLAVMSEELVELQKECDNFQEALSVKSQEHKALGVELHNLQTQSSAQADHLQNILREYQTQISSLSEENEFLKSTANDVSNSELVVNLREQLENIRLDADKVSNARQAKIQELEMFIETQEADLNLYKEKVNKLMEGLAAVEERRMSLEQRAIELGTQLHEKSLNYEEMSQSEDMLEQKLQALIAHDDAIEQRLQETTKDNQELTEYNRTLSNEVHELKLKLNYSNDKINQASDNAYKLEVLESENLQLKNIASSLESKLEESEKKIGDMKQDGEKIEIELQEQMESFEDDRKKLTIKNEQLQEAVDSLKQHEVDSEQKSILIEKLTKENAQISDLQLQLKQKIEQSSELLIKLEGIENNNSSLLRELKSYEDKLEQIKTSLDQYEHYNGILNKEKAELEKRIKDMETFKVATESTVDVDNILVQAQDNVNLTTFTWPQQQVEDPFAFVEITPEKSEVATQEHLDASKEKLLQKIKTLEFMLFSVEKEKDDALLQCHELSNELTRLIYERENKDVSKDLECQIVTASETIFSEANRKELKAMEYEKSSTNVVCHDETDYATAQPVVEEVVQATSAYICFGDEDTPKLDTFGDNDDGWGFGLDEVKLEEKHCEQNEMSNFMTQAKELDERVRVLELEREHHLEEIKQSHIKSGKLIKKLKEFKCKNEKLVAQLHKKSDEFPDLDDAIQDELKSQIQTLEKKIKDLQGDMDKDKHEKESLNKRLDVLTSANERMVELKEKQDVDLISWQMRNRELQQKLSELEWGDDAFDHPKSIATPKTEAIESKPIELAELHETIKDLMLDNEELQALLEEQKNLRVAAEKAKKSEPILENVKAEYLQVLAEKNELSNQLTVHLESNKRLQEELEETCNKHKILSSSVSESNAKVEGLLEKLLHEGWSNNDLSNQLKVLDIERKESPKMQQIEERNQHFENITRILEEASNQKQISEANMLAITEINQILQRSVQEKDVALEELYTQKQVLETQLNKLQSVVEDNEKLRMAVQENNSALEEISNQKQVLEARLQDNQVYQSNNQEKDDALEELSSLKQMLEIKLKELQEITEDNRTLRRNAQNATAAVDELATLKQTLELKLEDLRLCSAYNRDLETKLEAAVVVNEVLRSNVQELSAELEHVSNQNQILETKVKALRLAAEDMQNLEKGIQERNQELEQLSEKLNAEFDLKLSRNAETLSQEWSDRVDQRGSDVAESWKLHLDLRESEFVQMEKQLQKEMNEMEEKCNALVNENNELRKNVDAEIRNEVDRISTLQQHISNLTNAVQEKQLQLEQQLSCVQEKEQKLKEKEVIIIGLENSVIILQEQSKENQNALKTLRLALEKNSEGDNKTIQDLNIVIEQQKEDFIALQNEIASKQQLFEEHKEMVVTFQKQLQDYNQTYSSLEQQLNEKDLYISEISYKLQESEAFRTEVQQQLQESLNRNTVLNQEMQSHYNVLQQKTEELEQMKSQLLAKDEDFERVLAQSAHLEESASRKLESEALLEEATRVISELQLQLEDANKKLQNAVQENELLSNIVPELRTKTQQCEDLVLKLREYDILHEEQCKQMSDTKGFLDEQVKTIEDLKAELYDKSVDYDSLIAQINIPEQDSAVVKDNKQESRRFDTAERAELDLALYMLHQRDVRCEELTVEVMQLLGERDTLQLRLSNALREKEELRRRCGPENNSPDKPPSGSPTGAIPKSKASAILLGATGTELASEATEATKEPDDDPLANKLSELKTVGYNKDKSLVDEQDLRRMQQFSILQQHKDEVSKLPPEAAARLVDASYTLSRDVQSSSKVILDWLWGRSTPKVNDV